MIDLLTDERGFRHFLAVLVLLSRLGDVLSTYLISPTLLLESNAVVRRLGWPFAWLSVLLCAVPYYNTGVGVVVLTASFLVTGHNLSRCWIVRALGEAEYRALLVRAAKQGRRWSAVAFVLASGACVVLVGLLLMASSGTMAWGYWFGMGIVMYGGAYALHGSTFVLRLFREASAQPLDGRADGVP